MNLVFSKQKRGSSVCDIDSNLLALSCEESFLSWDMFKQNGLSNQTDSPAPVSCAHEEERVSWTCRWIGLSGYHKTLVWSWLVAELAKVAALSGDRVTAEKYLMFLESCALRDGTVAEIYEPQRPNKMFQTLFYKSEWPFSRWCAKTIEAIEVYRKLYPISRDIPYES